MVSCGFGMMPFAGNHNSAVVGGHTTALLWLLHSNRTIVVTRVCVLVLCASDIQIGILLLDRYYFVNITI